MNLRHQFPGKRLHRFGLPLTVLAVGFSAVHSEQERTQYPEDLIQESETSAHIRFLASDELMGRMTGTPGNDVAARYIAEQFRTSGVQTVSGASEYFQVVSLNLNYPAAGGQLVLFGDTLVQGKTMVLRSGGMSDVVAPVAFVGYGISDGAHGRDDYAGLAVKGKIVVAKFGASDSSDFMSGIKASVTKRQAAASRGAAALVELYSGSATWTTIRSFLSRPNYNLVSVEGDQAENFFPHVLVQDAKGTYAANSVQMKSVASLQSPGMRVERITSHNVVGVVEGSDARLRSEYVVLMAHFDHVGTRRVGTSPDSIFNGARDNGMGTVALISAAKALAARPPARSVLLLAVTGEEVGLLGSRHYVDHPLIPLENTVFVLNSDGAGMTDSNIVTVIGLERTTADVAIDSGAARYDLTAIMDPVPEQNLFDRSDNVLFARKGIPAPSFSPGFRAFDEAIRKYYHQPVDQADEYFPFSYLHRFCQAYAHAARRIADMQERPHWKRGDAYEAAGKLLYGN